MQTQELSLPEMYEEGRRYLAGHGEIHRALHRLAAELKHRNIDYVVIGAVALLAHGYPRVTDSLDVVLTNEGFERFRNEVLGHGGWGLPFGYDSVSEDAKAVRSSPGGVLIRFRIPADYPGDGKPKPIAFLNPSEASIKIDGVKYPTLEKLIELKLASGMTAPDRLKDLADVQELIKMRGLDREFAEKLHPYVREKYLELLDAVQRGTNFQEQS